MGCFVVAGFVLTSMWRSAIAELLVYMAISHHVKFLEGNILFQVRVWRTGARHYAKYCQNWSILCRDIQIFLFLKMAIPAILNFRNCEILLAVVSIEGPVASLCQIFSKSGCTGAKILQFFEFSRWPPPPSWIFKIAKLYLPTQSRGTRRISMPNFVQIGCSVVKILTFFHFSRWQLSAILICLGHFWTTHREYFGVSMIYHSAKFWLMQHF